jgi:bacteriocin-like protein
MRVLNEKELSKVEGGIRYITVNGKKIPIERIDRHSNPWWPNWLYLEKPN